MTYKVMLSCEHAFNSVPQEYRHLFKDADDILRSHRGYDPGAFETAGTLAEKLSAPFIHGSITRLVIDLNRSPHNKRSLFSPWTRLLPEQEKEQIIKRYYLPYRAKGEKTIRQLLKHDANVLHLSMHSFTPELHDKIRNADIGILYDPSRQAEKKLAAHLKELFAQNAPDLRVRRNYPYTGTADGFIPSLRRIFPTRYHGLEIELNQKHFFNSPKDWQNVKKAVVSSLMELVYFL